MDIKIPKVGDIISGTVVRVTQEEVLIDVGYMFEGTIYKDHLSNKKVTDARELVKLGDILEAKVTKLSHGDQTNILLMSRLDVEKTQVREQHINELQVNAELTAKVKRNNPGGLELEYHGIPLFMPNSMVDLQNVTEDFKKSLIGKDLLVRIIDIREERGQKRFVVNHKQIQFEELKKVERQELSTLVLNSTIKGTVTKILDFGAVVSLSDHVEGLIHISELSYYHIKDVNEVLSLGQQVEAKIIKIQGKKISLSLKALETKPWDLFVAKYKVGDTVKGKVVKKMQFGMLVEVEREVSGLLNRNDYSWDPLDNLAGKVQIGSEIELEIIQINSEKEQFSLSKKHLEYNPWADLHVKVGEVVTGTVKSFQEKGAILDVRNVDAFLPIGEIQSERVNRVDEVLKLGDNLSVEVLSFFPKEWKMVVSLKRVVDKAERREYEDQLKDNVSSDQSLADLFQKFKK